MNELLDLIDKEEIIETEDKIKKALEKEQEQRQQAKELKAKEDFAESEAKFLLKDKAEELKDESKKVSFEFYLVLAVDTRSLVIYFEIFSPKTKSTLKSRKLSKTTTKDYFRKCHHRRPQLLHRPPPRAVPRSPRTRSSDPKPQAPVMKLNKLA